MILVTDTTVSNLLWFEKGLYTHSLNIYRTYKKINKKNYLKFLILKPTYTQSSTVHIFKYILNKNIYDLKVL